MPIAESIDVEDIHVGRHDQEILGKGGEHVPRIKIHERGHEIQSECCCQSDEDDSRTIRSEEGLEKFAASFVELDVLFLWAMVCEGRNYQVE